MSGGFVLMAFGVPIQGNNATYECLRWWVRVCVCVGVCLPNIEMMTNIRVYTVSDDFPRI